MPRRKIAIEILAPIEGIETRLSGSMIPVRNVPTVRNCNAYYGIIHKAFGTSLLVSSTATTPGAVPINHIYEAVFPGATTLQVFNHTGMYKYTSVASGFANDGQVYTGTFTDRWHVCMHNNDMFYTNGVDLIQRKAAYNTTGANAVSVVTGSYKAYALVSFADHLIAYHTTEAGTQCRKRARWTKVGLLAHNGDDWTTGTAGFLDIQDGEGSLLTAEPLGGGAVVVYFEGSIHLQEWVGGSVVYRFTKMVTGLDIPNRRCVARNDAIHYVMTRENIYEYRGGREFIPIGDAIKNTYVNEMNSSAMDTAYMQFIKEDNELRIYIPTAASTMPDTCFICKIGDGNKWFKAERPYTANGTTSRPAALTIGELVGNIGAQTWKFGDVFVNAEAPTYLLGDTTGNVVKMDKAVYSISVGGTSQAQTFEFPTKDLSASGDVDPEYSGQGKYFDKSEYASHKSRWLSIKAECAGEGSVTAWYSVDGSRSWIQCPEGAKTVTSEWEPYIWDVDITSELFAAKFVNSGTNEVIQIRFVKVEFVPGAEA